MLEAITSYVAGIDWVAVGKTALILPGLYCPWLILRNDALGKMLERLFHEEVEWCKEHESLFRGRLHRLDSLPSYWVMLFSLWRPLKEFEELLKPIPEYYKEQSNETVKENHN